MVTVGAAGHVIPMFELAKGMKNHNVTFLSERGAERYVNLESYPNISSLRLIYLNTSLDKYATDKKMGQDLIAYMINHTLFDSLAYFVTERSESVGKLMNKTVHLVMEEQFDVIVGTGLTLGLHSLCQDANISCVIQLSETELSIFSINQPGSQSLLSKKQLSSFIYRIYDVAFAIRAILPAFPKLFNIYSMIINNLPQVPGPFYDTFTLKNLLLKKPKCLKLYSLPPTLFSPRELSYSSKYLGGFIDESSIKNVDNELTKWINSKPEKSIIYVAFGSVSILDLNRMKNLIYGLTEFLLQTNSTSILLAFRYANIDHFETVFAENTNEDYRRILMNKERVRIENEFIQQKWILQQPSIGLFVSHCGMGSIVESIHFQKPILCLPLCTDQFVNAIAIEHSSVGESLFQPPSIIRSFQNPMAHYKYAFTTEDVTSKVMMIWRNETYEEMVRMMSLEMKHAGGVKRAVEEIEFLVSLKGNLDRYAPFHSTLPFYQRYMIDIIIIYIILPVFILIRLFKRCCKRTRKQKIE